MMMGPVARSRVLLALSLCCLCRGGDAYRPVVVMHGIFDSAKSLSTLVQRIQEAHPGTPILNVDLFDDLDSITPMWEQVKGVEEHVRPFMQSAADGVNMICYSQGTLICRALLETMSDHNVHTFISLSGPHGGQFGDTEYLKYLFPNWLRDNIYKLFYTNEGQDISVANYWKDPHHLSLYYQYCNFLPKLNNGSADYKANFLRLKQIVFIGGPDDGVITPWQSSRFGFYDASMQVVDIYSQQVYAEDTFGLRTLDKAGGLKWFAVPGVQHQEWPRDQEVFQKFIEPYLA